MIELRIPIENKVTVLIGDIYVHCDITFRTRGGPPGSSMEAMCLDQLNSRLHQLGYEIAAEVSQKVENRLKQSEGG